MTEYCQISCSLVNYSLGPLILCWESCTHLALCVALKVNVAVDSLHLQTIQLHMIVRHRCFPVTAYLHLKPKPSLMTLPTSWLCVKLCVSLHFDSSINSAARGRWLLFNHFTCEIVLHVTTWQCFCCREEQGLHSMGASGQEYARQATTQSVGKPCNH